MVLTDKQKQLVQLLSDGRFHSGNDLALKLMISRSAVWKHLQGLAELGIDVHAINGKGYRLERALSLLNLDEINAALSSDSINLIAQLELFDQLDSTNTYLMAQAKQASQSSCICLAEYQSSGKGRRGRQWVSPFANNIYLSILWRFNQGLSGLGGLSLVIGVAVVRALQQLGIADLGLKWPNDIVWQNKKLGGILIEVIGETEGPCSAVIGLGLNVYLPAGTTASITQPWVDLERILGHPNTNRSHLTAALLNAILPILADFNPNTLAAYLQEWRRYDCMKDKSVTLFMLDRQIQGVVQGINADGLLTLATQNGEVKNFASGELSFNPHHYETIA